MDWLGRLLRGKAYALAEEFQGRAENIVARCRTGNLSLTTGAVQLKGLHEEIRRKLLAVPGRSGLRGGVEAYERIVRPTFSECVTELEVLRISSKIEKHE